MKLNHRAMILGSFLLVLVTAAILVVSYKSSAAQSASSTETSGREISGAAGARQISQAGGVTIEATWENPSEAGTSPIRFAIAMNTHSVDLDGYNLGELAVLRNDEGLEVIPDTWNAAPGGHHRTGRLIFPEMSDGQPLVGPETTQIELVIRDVAGVKERSFQWEVPR